MSGLLTAVCMALLLYTAVMLFRRYRTDYERKLLLSDRIRPEELNAVRSEWHQSRTRLIGVVGGTEWAQATGDYLGSVDQLGSVLEAYQIDSVCLDVAAGSELGLRCMRECQIRGIPVELRAQSLAGVPSKAQLIHTDAGDVVRLVPHRQTPGGQLLKRLTDIALAGTALLILSPTLLIIALVVKLTSPGPVMFKQVRVGLRGRTFTMYKFRSMVVDAEERKQQLAHLNEMSGPVFKMKDDPRVTRIGRILRKTSLDELPQLWNVLRGQMSLVGPRPPLPSEVSKYDAWQRRRLTVKPGLTCFWQISGRNDVDFEQWMAMDLDYIDRWSYRLDWMIMLKTLPAVLLRKGAS